jgi:DNA-binding NarL/FixJ family response regulator
MVINSGSYTIDAELERMDASQEENTQLVRGPNGAAQRQWASILRGPLLRFPTLTDQETLVAWLTYCGRSRAQIAAQLRVSRERAGILSRRVATIAARLTGA